MTQMILSKMILVPELIPRTSFFKNLRSMLSRKAWDEIRFKCYQDAGHCCEICHVKPKKLDCHEIWEYDSEKGQQRLVGVVALCSACHEVKHIGLAQMRGRAKDAMDHMMKVNNIDLETCCKLVDKAFEEWQIRNQQEWTLDVSWLEH